MSLVKAGNLIKAGLGHLAVLAAMHATAFPQEPWDETVFAHLIEDPHITILIDPRGGFITLRQVLDEAEIITICATAHRQGIARTLIAAARARPGLTVLHLEVAADNEPALALYGAMGFTPTGRRRAYYNNGTDALTMSWRGT